jgi:hypothetical protein
MTMIIAKPEHHLRNGTSMIETGINGQSVWFSSVDTELRPVPEAFANPMILPAMHQGMDITIDDEVCPKWLDNTTELMATFAEWWGYDPVKISHRGFRNGPSNGADRTGLVFSCGVDSFFTLLRYDGTIDDLVFIHGLELPHRHPDRLEAFRKVLARIARRQGKKALVMETNFREHPLFDSVPFERSHGGLLSAVGHAGADYRKLVISASPSVHRPTPFGSHFEIDHLWSSCALEVDHFGHQERRRDKLVHIAGEEVVQENMRVCFENLTSAVHCGTCEKCVRTELILLKSGQLEKFSSFNSPIPLADRIDNLRRGYHKKYLANEYSGFLGVGLGQDIEEAIHRYIRRVNWMYHPVKVAFRDSERFMRINTRKILASCRKVFGS